MKKFLQQRIALIGLVLLLILCLLALSASLIAPFPVEEQIDLAKKILQAPSAQHYFGTDALSRDIFSRVLAGGQISLSIGFLSVVLAVSVGTAVGAAAGFWGGWLDAVLMRLVDVLLSLPRLVLLLAVVGLWPGQHTFTLIILVLGLTGWMSTSRLVRAEVMALKELEFVLASKSLGNHSLSILWRHILPNCLGVISVSATLGVGSTILLESSLAFLGLGLAPPQPTWGNMVAEGREYLLESPWVALFPGLAIVITVLAVNFVGEGLRRTFQVKSL